MAETSYPYPDQAITLAQFRAWARQAFGSRVRPGREHQRGNRDG